MQQTFLLNKVVEVFVVENHGRLDVEWSKIVDTYALFFGTLSLSLLCKSSVDIALLVYAGFELTASR